MKPIQRLIAVVSSALMQRAGLVGPATHVHRHTFIAASTKHLLPDRRKLAAQHHSQDGSVRLNGSHTNALSGACYCFIWKESHKRI
jgi:hypothetical protein